MSDLIERQALMKEFSDFVRASNNSDFAQVPTWNDAVSLVGSMPSAQPEIIRCKDCKWWDKDGDSPRSYCLAMKHGYISSNWEIGIYRRYKGDFYCADAEREEEDE